MHKKKKFLKKRNIKRIDQFKKNTSPCSGKRRDTVDEQGHCKKHEDKKRDSHRSKGSVSTNNTVEIGKDAIRPKTTIIKKQVNYFSEGQEDLNLSKRGKATSRKSSKSEENSSSTISNGDCSPQRIRCRLYERECLIVHDYMNSSPKQMLGLFFSQKKSQFAENGQSANCQRVILPGIDLEDANFSYADFSYANLTDASLKGTKLFETILEGADITNVKGLTAMQLSEAKFTSLKVLRDDRQYNDARVKDALHIKKQFQTIQLLKTLISVDHKEKIKLNELCVEKEILQAAEDAVVRKVKEKQQSSLATKSM